MRAAAILILLFAACAGPIVPDGEPEPVAGPDPRYRRLDTILERFAALERARPDLVRLETIGRSRRGEAIVAIVVGRRPPPGDPADPRPVVLLHAAQHANEPAGTGALMVLVERLLEGYGADARLTEIVDGVVIWVVPIVNPDGHRRVFSGAPGWDEWRKNGREPHGVDLNRNWDHRWEEDPSTDPASRNYKGPRPFSEPEVVAIRDLVLRERPVIVLDLHSPGEITPGNVVFWPWLRRATRELGPDASVYRAIAEELASRTETEVDGEFCREAPAYDTLPKEQCWIYRETGCCVLLAEISGRFWFEGPMVETIAESAATGCVALLERALGGPGLLTVATDAETGEPLVAEVIVPSAHDPEVGPRRTDPRDGAARRFLAPGEVTVTIRADGYAPASRRLEIADESWTRVEVGLERR